MKPPHVFRAYPPLYVREKDTLYLTLVRQRGCIVNGCHRETEVHHLVTRGSGGSDLSTIPMCREHHAEIHTMGVHSFEVRHCVSVWSEAAACLAIYVRYLKEIAQ